MVRTYSLAPRLALRLALVSTMALSVLACSRDAKKLTGGSSARITMPEKFATLSSKIQTLSTTKTKGWGLPDLTSVDQVDCYMVVVDVPELKGNTCSDDAGAVVLRPSIVKGLIAPGGSISLELPSGAARKFSLLGFSKLATSECVDYKADNFSRAQFSAPVIVAQTTQDMPEGDIAVSMTLGLKNFRPIQYCSGTDIPKAWVAPTGARTVADISNTQSTISFVSGSVASGTTSELILATRDLFNDTVYIPGLMPQILLDSANLTAGTIGSVIDLLDGTYKAQFTASVAAVSVRFNSVIDGKTISNSAQFTVVAGAISPVKSEVVVPVSTLTSGDATTVTLIARDAANNRIYSGGATVQFSISGGSSTGTFGSVVDHNDGTYTAVLTAGAAGSVAAIGALINGVAVSTVLPGLTVLPGNFSLSQSVVSVSSGAVTSGSTVTVSLTLKDFSGNTILSGAPIVAFSHSGGASTASFSTVTYAGNGVYNSTLTGLVSGSATTIHATINTAIVTSTMPVVTVSPGNFSLAQSTLTVSNSTIASGSTLTATLQLRDAAGNLVTTGTPTVSFTISGGVSGGTFASVTNHNNGSYSALMTGTVSGTASGIFALIDGSLTTGSPATFTVTPGTLSLSQSSVNLASSTVVSGSAATVSLMARDAFGNLVGGGGGTVVFSASAGGGVSTGGFGTVTDYGDGNYSALFTGITAGTPTNITATINSSALTSGAASLTVVPGLATNVFLSGPASITADDCTTAFSAVLKDANGNVTTHSSDLTLTLNGKMNGRIYSDLSCNNEISDPIVTASSSNVVFYFRDSVVESPTLNAGGSVLSLSGNNVGVSVTPSVAWIGPTAGIQWESLGAITAGGKKDGMLYGPNSVYVDPSGNLYVADGMNHRVARYNNSGAFTGWVGAIAESPTGGAGGCSGAAPGTVTPGWCMGGTSTKAAPSSAANGALSMPTAITGDGTYFYVANSSYNRIEKFNLSTGAFAGWIGKISSNASMTGAGGCSGAANGTTTPGWCINGISTSGNSDGQYASIKGLYFHGGNLYVSDSGNGRIQKIDASSGLMLGWVGKIATQPTSGAGGCNTATVGDPTPGWCVGGSSTAANTDGAFQTPNGLWVDGTHFYVTNNGGNRIAKHNLSTGVFVGWIGYISNNSGLGGDAGCSGAPNNSFTPGWCTGGTSVASQVATGGQSVATDIKGDGTYLFVINSLNNRVDRYNAITGAYQGWIGRYGGAPTAAGAAGCSAMTPGMATPGWCSNGNTKAGSGDGEFFFAGASGGTGLEFNNGNLFIADNGNNRIVKYTATSGQIQGWSGGVANNSAPRWQRMTAPSGMISARDVFFNNTNLPGTGDGGVAGISLIGTSLYATDRGNHNVKKFDLISGQFLGWRGAVDRIPASGDSGCNGVTPGSATPGFCLGGTSVMGTIAGALKEPQAIVASGAYSYVLEYGRIQRFNAATGAPAGWIGKIANIASIGGDAGCSGATVGTYTPGWCTGGSAAEGNTDGALSGARGMVISNGYIYVTDSLNARINKYNETTGAFVGWIGKASNVAGMGGAVGCNAMTVNTATPGWCTGGAASAGISDGMFNNPASITSDGTHIYIADEVSGRLLKYNESTGQFVGWIGKISSISGIGGGAGCTGATANSLTPAWCTGGTSAATTTVTPDGSAINLRSIVYRNGFIYVVDGAPIKSSVLKFDANTGSYEGWKGTVLTVPSSGAPGCTGLAVGAFSNLWCKGGSPGRGKQDAMSLDMPGAITADNHYMYLLDGGSSRILRVPID